MSALEKWKKDTMATWQLVWIKGREWLEAVEPRINWIEIIAQVVELI
jgi:hypothetical protein